MSEFYERLDKACADAWVDRIADAYMSHPRRIRGLRARVDALKQGIREMQAELRDTERELARVERREPT